MQIIVDRVELCYHHNTYFKECIQLVFTGFNLLTVRIAKWKIRENFLWAFDI